MKIWELNSGEQGIKKERVGAGKTTFAPAAKHLRKSWPVFITYYPGRVYMGT